MISEQAKHTYEALKAARAERFARVTKSLPSEKVFREDNGRVRAAKKRGKAKGLLQLQQEHHEEQIQQQQQQETIKTDLIAEMLNRGEAETEFFDGVIQEQGLEKRDFSQELNKKLKGNVGEQFWEKAFWSTDDLKAPKDVPRITRVTQAAIDRIVLDPHAFLFGLHIDNLPQGFVVKQIEEGSSDCIFHYDPSIIHRTTPLTAVIHDAPWPEPAELKLAQIVPPDLLETKNDYYEDVFQQLLQDDSGEKFRDLFGADNQEKTREILTLHKDLFEQAGFNAKNYQGLLYIFQEYGYDGVDEVLKRLSILLKDKKSLVAFRMVFLNGQDEFKFNREDWSWLFDEEALNSIKKITEFTEGERIWWNRLILQQRYHEVGDQRFYSCAPLKELLNTFLYFRDELNKFKPPVTLPSLCELRGVHHMGIGLDRLLYILKQSTNPQEQLSYLIDKAPEEEWVRLDDAGVGSTGQELLTREAAYHYVRYDGGHLILPEMQLNPRSLVGRQIHLSYNLSIANIPGRLSDVFNNFVASSALYYRYFGRQLSRCSLGEARQFLSELVLYNPSQEEGIPKHIAFLVPLLSLTCGKSAECMTAAALIKLWKHYKNLPVSENLLAIIGGLVTLLFNSESDIEHLKLLALFMFMELTEEGPTKFYRKISGIDEIFSNENFRSNAAILVDVLLLYNIDRSEKFIPIEKVITLFTDEKLQKEKFDSNQIYEMVETHFKDEGIIFGNFDAIDYAGIFKQKLEGVIREIESQESQVRKIFASIRGPNQENIGDVLTNLKTTDPKTSVDAFYVLLFMVEQLPPMDLIRIMLSEQMSRFFGAFKKQASAEIVQRVDDFALETGVANNFKSQLTNMLGELNKETVKAFTENNESIKLLIQRMFNVLRRTACDTEELVKIISDMLEKKFRLQELNEMLDLLSVETMPAIALLELVGNEEDHAAARKVLARVVKSGEFKLQHLPQLLRLELNFPTKDSLENLKEIQQSSQEFFEPLLKFLRHVEIGDVGEYLQLMNGNFNKIKVDNWLKFIDLVKIDNGITILKHLSADDKQPIIFEIILFILTKEQPENVQQLLAKLQRFSTADLQDLLELYHQKKAPSANSLMQENFSLEIFLQERENQLDYRPSEKSAWIAYDNQRAHYIIAALDISPDMKQRFIASLTYVRELSALYKTLSKEQLIEELRTAQGVLFQSNTTSLDKLNSRLKILAILQDVIYRTMGLYPYASQMIAVMNAIFAEGNLITQMNTGEGKSVVTLLLAGMLVTEGHCVDICTADYDLATRDQKKAASFFDYLNIKSMLVHSSSSLDDYHLADVHFSDAGNHALFKLRAKMQKKQLRNNKPATLLVDEADQLILDDVTDYNLSASVTASAAANVNPYAWLYPIMMEFITTDSFRSGYVSRADDVAYLRAYINDKPDLSAEQRGEILSTITDDQLDRWLDAACAADSLEEGVDFIVQQEERMIGGETKNVSMASVLIDKRVSHTTRWGGGVHQMLHAKLQKNLQEGESDFICEPERAIVATSNNRRLIKYYSAVGGRVLGLTGTAGSQREKVEQAQDYGMQFSQILPYKTSQRQDQPDLFEATEEKQVKAIIRLIAKYPRHPVLIHCRDIQTLNRLQKAISGNIKNRDIQSITGATSSEERVAGVAKAGRSNQVTFSTVYSRGTDIELQNKALGMVVIDTDWTMHRETQQKRGRAGRQGEPGITYGVYNLATINPELTKWQWRFFSAYVNALATLQTQKEESMKNFRQQRDQYHDIKMDYLQRHYRWYLHFKAYIETQGDEIKVEDKVALYQRVLQNGASLIQHLDVCWQEIRERGNADVAEFRNSAELIWNEHSTALEKMAEELQLVPLDVTGETFDRLALEYVAKGAEPIGPYQQSAFPEMTLFDVDDADTVYLEFNPTLSEDEKRKRLSRSMKKMLDHLWSSDYFRRYQVLLKQKGVTEITYILSENDQGVVDDPYQAVQNFVAQLLTSLHQQYHYYRHDAPAVIRLMTSTYHHLVEPFWRWAHAIKDDRMKECIVDAHREHVNDIVKAENPADARYLELFALLSKPNIKTPVNEAALLANVKAVIKNNVNEYLKTARGVSVDRRNLVRKLTADVANRKELPLLISAINLAIVASYQDDKEHLRLFGRRTKSRYRDALLNAKDYILSIMPIEKIEEAVQNERWLLTQTLAYAVSVPALEGDVTELKNSQAQSLQDLLNRLNTLIHHPKYHLLKVDLESNFKMLLKLEVLQSANVDSSLIATRYDASGYQIIDTRDAAQKPITHLNQPWSMLVKQFMLGKETRDIMTNPRSFSRR